MINLALIGLAIGALIAIAIPTPCDPGKIVCPVLPDYDGQYGRELASELAALPDGFDAVRREHAEHMRLIVTLARACGSA